VSRFRVVRDVVVVAAHPDDETIGAAAVLLRAARPAVVHVTDGAPRDPALRPAGAADRAAYARLRRQEALAALAEARVLPADVVGLGSVDQEASRVIAPLARELAELLRRLAPRAVVTHALEGGHPDHDATAVATRAALALLARRGAAPSLLEMTSYHLRDGRLATGRFLPGGARARVLTLDARERATKRRMIGRYASQRAVLAPFGVARERLREARPADVRARPHAGPLHYEVLGWATFARWSAAAVAALEALGLAAGEEVRAP
jgi:LmbE family N-acetylglucosaminyl deacetylase